MNESSPLSPMPAPASQSVVPSIARPAPTPLPTKTLAPPPADAPLPSTSSPVVSVVEPNVKQRAYQQYDDLYIIVSAGELTFLQVRYDPKLKATVAIYTSQPQVGSNWELHALAEASRMARARSTIRIHTLESSLSQTVRNLRDILTTPPGQELRNMLSRNGKSFILARPERESPLWQETMKLLKDGKLPLPSPLVTYTVHTSAVTDYEHVYTGVVMVGLGSIVVHSEILPGDDLVSAELQMMEWVIENTTGGGRIDVHHCSDGARRIWEQAAHLATLDGADSLGQEGRKLRALALEAYRKHTTIHPAGKADAIFSRFARTAAAGELIGQQYL